MRFLPSTRRLGVIALGLGGWVLSGLGLAAGTADAAPLRVCATTPDAGSLVREIGGDRVEITVFGKGTEDPHFIEAKPSFVKSLSQAELYVQTGMDIELGWAPVLLQQSRNPRIRPGSPGFLDLSPAVGRALDLPSGAVDRSMGDVHPLGNPHYLADPLRGLAAAQLIATKLAELAPAEQSYFAERLRSFRRELFDRLVGKALAERYGDDVPKLALLFQTNRLVSFLEERGQRELLDGWLGEMAPHYGAKAIDDHPIWSYFAQTFGLVIVGHLEPLPGVPPTTKHLGEIVELMRSQGIRLVLASAYYDPRYAKLVAEKTGAKVLRMANQVGAVPAAATYLDAVSYNVEQVAEALGAGR